MGSVTITPSPTKLTTPSPTESPTVSPTESPTESPTTFPTESQVTSAPTEALCSAGNSRLDIEVKGDKKGKKNKTEYDVFLKSKKGKFQSILKKPKKITSKNKVYRDAYCIEDEKCHRFRISEK